MSTTGGTTGTNQHAVRGLARERIGAAVVPVSTTTLLREQAVTSAFGAPHEMVRQSQDAIAEAQATGDVERLRELCAAMYASAHEGQDVYAQDELGQAIRMRRTVEFPSGRLPKGHITFVIEPQRNQPKGVVAVLRTSDAARSAIQPGDFELLVG